MIKATLSPVALRQSNEARCRRILERSELLPTDDLDWERAGDVELDSGVIDALVYMRDVEGFTDSYLIGLAAHTTTFADPLVRSFLSVWQAEEAAHSAAIDRFLVAYGQQRDVSIRPPQPSPSPKVPFPERVLAHVGGPIGRLVATAHMTWGAANEQLTMNGYRLLADQCRHPLLAALLRRIAAQESRHYSFYLLQAQWRLASSPMARRVLPRIMRGGWTPVGVGDGYKSLEEFEQVLEVLRSQPDSQKIIDRMDRRFASLPGLEQLRIYRDGLPSSQAA